MDKEQIGKWIKESHENAVEKGFYQCKNCAGIDPDSCLICNGTGIDPNKNIGELLMLIVSELGEALEAHRCGRFAIPQEKWESDYITPHPLNHMNHPQSIHNYEVAVKGSFEEEIADVFIRLFDLCGYVRFEINELNPSNIIHHISNVGEMLLVVVENVSSVKKGDYMSVVFCLNFLLNMCNKLNIPIEKYIEAKMSYNKTRPYRHGKEY